MPPVDVVRHDDDDLLVVAADKGTTTFSDIINAIAVDAKVGALSRQVLSRL